MGIIFSSIFFSVFVLLSSVLQLLLHYCWFQKSDSDGFSVHFLGKGRNL